MILITGATGKVGGLLVRGLPASTSLLLSDISEPSDTESRVRHDSMGGTRIVDLTDPVATATLMENVEAIIHLAGEARAGAGWGALMENNLRATANLFDAAGAAGVRKIVYASSVHASGAYNDPATWPVDPDWPCRPCCRYGASKAAGESMAKLYSDTHPESSVVSLRLALVADPPRWRPEVDGWLAAEDLVGLFLAALNSRISYGVFFGASPSGSPRYRLEKNESRLGYRSQIYARPTESMTDVPPDYAEDCILWRPQIEETVGPARRRSGNP